MAYPSIIETDTFLTRDGVRLNLLRAGRGAQVSKAVVILIPGWCMPATIWRETTLALAPDREIIGIDPRGQGDSEIPGHGYHIDQRADDIAQCIAHAIGPGNRIVLVGWSLGALEALHYVQRHGENKLDGLVLVDSSVGEEPSIPAAQGFRDGLRADRHGTLERFVRAMFRSTRPEAEIAALTARALRMPLEASLALFPSHLPREHWRGITRTLRAPLLYAVTPQFAAQAENLKKARPATQVEIFSAAGHALFADEPGRFNRLLAEFSDNLDACH